MVLNKEFDKPLGLGPAKRGRFTRSDAAAAVVGVAVIGLSAWVATAPRPWRVATPPQAPVEAAQPAVPSSQPAAPPQAKQQQAGGPQIIHVDPGTRGSATLTDPASFSKSTVAPYLPDPALIERTPEGQLPVRAADGRRPFDVYKRPLSSSRGARVAIVIGGLGLSQTGTQAAIQKLPPDVTLAFATSGNSLNRWMQEARRDNREILLQLPLEPFDYPQVDPGRNTLTVDAGADENAKRLHWSLGRTTNYAGVMNYMGARFSADGNALKPVMDEIGQRGLMYFDDGSTPRSLAADLAPAARAPFARADLVIDGSRDRTAIFAQLDALEKTAHSRGAAIGMGYAFEATVDAVREWSAQAAKRGVEIVPLSALAADPER
ncbi:divergent polysaccharide deacetylase family protein [Mesorhizobium sp. RP14(2022)]|uniref:Divergent polysaccharide deacetylase family protein n=1 Tax=Mesorhizobium liriopis TaxID=2953882 RepID=A0ABT1C8S7_9HYPH|nr:divergent polysaccharide deacetylase family protein [Mesorhizobium liriopis]